MAEECVAVVRTGVANLASVLAGLRRAGAAATLVDQATAVGEARRVVLPGVGSFAAAMTQLRQRNLEKPLAERIRRGRPTLAICLGLQLLGTGSEESPDRARAGCVRRADHAFRLQCPRATVGLEHAQARR